ncbi:MAG: flippase-like domain-containing protein [Candidatus Aureabacteria bacterium]|nr:flippase-like domain-containing protein [Candidatus Auribacterota bacterium]
MSATRPSITVFFPCFNEEENVEKQTLDVDRVLSKIADDYEVVIVNDGSIDRTGEIADRLAAEHPHVRVIHHPHNLGYGIALKTGFLGARKELVFYTDGDNQFDIREISKLLPLMRDNVDMVVGYRMDRQDKPLRKFVSRVYNFIIRMIFRLKVRDIDCAFKLFRRSVFDRIEIRSQRFLIDTEILVRAKQAGMTIVETGVTHLPRTAGKSSVSPRDVIHTLHELSHLWLHLFAVNWKKLIVSSLVSIAFIALILRNIDFASVAAEFSKVTRAYIWLGLLAYAVSFWFRSVRWKLLLLPERAFRIGELFTGIVIGWMANNILPFRMGEVVRAYDFGRVHRFSKSLCFATIVVERLIDGLTLILFLAMILMFVSFKPIVNRIFVLGIIIFFSLFIILFYLVAGKALGKKTGIFKLVDNFGQRFLKAEGQFVISSFLKGLEVLMHERLMLGVFALTALVWCAEAGMYWAFLMAFHLELPAYAPFFILCIVNLGLIVPSIGYVGTFEWFCKVALLQLASPDPALVAGYSIALHAAQFIPVTLLGIFFFIRHNFDVVKARDGLRVSALGD